MDARKFSSRLIVIENPGDVDMQITVREDKELKRYEASGKIGEEEGMRAGITYRLDDGRMIYIPEGQIQKRD